MGARVLGFHSVVSRSMTGEGAVYTYRELVQAY